jgi:hypothetical protein
MAHPVLPLLLSITYATAPNIDLHAKSKDPISCMKADLSMILIAGSHAGEDPHGDDPHGADPHDENHDPGLPSNQYKKERKAPSDPYGGQYPNTKEPY